MNFVSLQYGLLLLPITWLIYWLLPSRRARLLVLLLASNVFYIAWSEKLVALLWFSTVLDFVCGRALGALDPANPESSSGPADRRRLWLYVSLVGNLGILGLFKYYGFFVDSAIALIEALGFSAHPRTLELILPLGISFYTFQSMSYTIDIYRGHLKPHKSFLEFSVFIAFFPQLVAGPIVRARDFLPQLARKMKLDWSDVQWGCERILIGMVKKAVIADNLAPIVEQGFSGADGFTSTHVWMATLAFYGQVYFDFSGYSDIAIGSSRLFGFRIKENFDRPYLTTSPQEYWQRWHISLSTWLRDYVYFPLGGNRIGPTRTNVNLFMTMFISGLWHGAAWTFAIWGAYHGACLIAHRIWNRSGHSMPWLPALLGQVAFTCVGYFMFRASSWENMVDVLGAAVTLPTTLPNGGEMLALLICFALFTIEPLGPRVRAHCEAPVRGPMLRGALLAFGIVLLTIARPDKTPDFVYFVF